MRNTLSAQRREFLQAGGVSYFIGDSSGVGVGAGVGLRSIQYKPEQVLETFYSFGLARGTWLTADYQRIQNPAYNADRGPVNVYAVRFHAEF
jgi:hypothetical protein